MSTAAVRRHWQRVAAMGCIVCGGPAEIAHCHGGSVRDKMQEPKARGKKLDRYNNLVLPLCPFHHRLGGPGYALDSNVLLWERVFGSQVSHIDRLCNLLGVDLWAKANEGRK